MLFKKFKSSMIYKFTVMVIWLCKDKDNFKKIGRKYYATYNNTLNHRNFTFIEEFN